MKRAIAVVLLGVSLAGCATTVTDPQQVLQTASRSSTRIAASTSSMGRCSTPASSQTSPRFG